MTKSQLFSNCQVFTWTGLLSKNLLFKMRIEQIAYSYIFLNFYERGTFEVDFIVSDYIPFREVLPKTLF